MTFINNIERFSQS